jgi:maf-like protein
MKTNSDNPLLSNYDRIILASKSPRRLDILREHGIEPIVLPGNADESLPDDISFTDAVVMLSDRKALAALEHPKIAEFEGKSLIIASDTIVYKDKVMGKPIDEEDAFIMLSSLRNDKHYVASGVTLIAVINGEPQLDNRMSFAEITEIICGDYTDEDIRSYIATGEPMDKAGAYAIQGGFRKYISEFKGDYENVVGLPYNMIISELNK